MPTPRTHEFLGFEASHLPAKKYNAVLLDRKTGRQSRMPFGDRAYEQFKDRTGLGLYSKLDHGDPVRRANYRARHAKDLNVAYSPSWFALKYLW